MINLPDILANFTSHGAGQSHNAAGNVPCPALILTPAVETNYIYKNYEADRIVLLSTGLSRKIKRDS